MQNKKKLILFVNLGSPKKPEATEIRKYLREFLSDEHVIDLNPFLWKIILNAFILPFRPKRLVPLYQSIWKEDKSPLHYHTEKQTELIKEKIANENIEFHFAMRYGEPSIKSKLEYCKEKNIEEVYIVPLFPQFSNTTSGSIIDKANECIAPYRNKPYLNFYPQFYNKPLFYKSIAKKINMSYEKKPFEYLLLSYHGLPKRYVELGDPYYEQCLKSSELISNELADLPITVKTVFQSRFGKEEWLKPYCDHYIKEIAENGVKSVAIHSPSFISDCLETISELGQEIRDIFLKYGGEEFTFINSLNDDLLFTSTFAEDLKKTFNL
jgi:protoporphyrin/coproporphyrin ferrochelatase